MNPSLSNRPDVRATPRPSLTGQDGTNDFFCDFLSGHGGTRATDSLHFSAAQGWFELGNHLEAIEECEQIMPAPRAHPDVMELGWQIPFLYM